MSAYTSLALSRRDPVVPDWANLELPDTWPDRLDLSRPKGLIALMKAVLGCRERVEIPAELVGRDLLPKYALQEFHNLPNGNYSNSLTAGYVKGFDVSMLNKVDVAREKLAETMKGKGSVLDVGCAGGKTAAAVKAIGVDDVWGLDPSPYLLKLAANTYPDIKFVQGTAESNRFDDQRFAGIVACFVFHEIPPKYADKALVEFNRVLQPGGIVAIAEPSAIQLQESNPFTLIKHNGLSALYFMMLARFVYEPFVQAWHQRNVEAWLDQHGFDLVEDQDKCPIRTIVAKKR